MDRITYTMFVRLLTNQPYFVWHKDVINHESEDEMLAFDLASYRDVIAPSIQEVQAKSFHIIEKKFDEMIKDQFDRIYFVKGKTIDDQIAETKKALATKKIDHIINPVFSYTYNNYQVLAQPKIFSKQASKISFLKISTSTRIKDILRLMFDYLVLEKLGYKIKDASLYILKTKDYKQREVDFYETRYINTTKTARKANGDYKYDYGTQQLIKSGELIKSDGTRLEKDAIITILKQGFIKKNKQAIPFKTLSIYLDQIIKARSSNKIIPPTNQDGSQFESSCNWDFILRQTNSRWRGYSGNIVNRKTIINCVPEAQILAKSKVAQLIKQNEIIVTKRKQVEKAMRALEGQIVWYDFEAISLPFAPIDHVLPFNQVVTQVSVIKTNNLQETSVHNLVLDPKRLQPHHFVKIINAIYQKGAQYVVYNKAYENTRLQEMVKILDLDNYPETTLISKKVQQIIANTIDLADFFICSTQKMPMIFIPFLKGKHSIKIIEQYISQANLKLPYHIKEYKNLNVKNGMEAMEIANNRALGIIGDKQWKQTVLSLEAYCENDVRAMIMVYHLVKKLLEITKAT